MIVGGIDSEGRLATGGERRRSVPVGDGVDECSVQRTVESGWWTRCAAAPWTQAVPACDLARQTGLHLEVRSLRGSQPHPNTEAIQAVDITQTTSYVLFNAHTLSTSAHRRSTRIATGALEPDLELVREVAATPPIFIAGSMRSGTTLLQSIVSAHPEIDVVYETHFAADLPQGISSSAAINWLTTTSGYDRLHLPWDGAKVRDMLTRLGPTSAPEAVRMILALRAVLFGKRRFGDKAPLYAFHLRSINRLYPDARIVLLVRDGRYSAASAAQPNVLLPNSILIDALIWRAAARRSFAALRSLRPDRLLVIRYEDLIEDHECQCLELCRFVGVEFDDAMLHPNVGVSERVAISQEELDLVHPNLSRPPQKIAHDWRTGVSAADVRSVEVILRSSLAMFGYPIGPRHSGLDVARGWTRTALVAVGGLRTNLPALRNQARRDMAATWRRVVG